MLAELCEHSGGLAKLELLLEVSPVRVCKTLMHPQQEMEPMAGIEPATNGLRNRCSTTELHWRPILLIFFYLPGSLSTPNGCLANARKGSRLPHEAGLKLVTVPRAPKELPVTVHLARNPDKVGIAEWKLFLNE